MLKLYQNTLIWFISNLKLMQMLDFSYLLLIHQCQSLADKKWIRKCEILIFFTKEWRHKEYNQCRIPLEPYAFMLIILSTEQRLSVNYHNEIWPFFQKSILLILTILIKAAIFTKVISVIIKNEQWLIKMKWMTITSLW